MRLKIKTVIIILTAFLTVLISDHIYTAKTSNVFAADTGFLRVITEDTPFYADKNSEKPLFFLPYTYYVKIIEYGELTCRVEYADGGTKIDGYVPTLKLYSDGLPVTDPFPKVTVTTAKTAVLYADSDTTTALQYVFQSRDMFYYGKYFSAIGGAVYYVSYNNKLGYVKEEDLIPFTVENHPNELTFIKKEEPTFVETETEDKPTENLSNLRILIIAVLGAAGLIGLIFAITKRPKPRPTADYYDENDYE